MAEDPDVRQVAAAVRLSVGLLIRRLRQTPVEGGLALPESSALARLERGGPATASELAKLEQISPQSMGATLAALDQVLEGRVRFQLVGIKPLRAFDQRRSLDRCHASIRLAGPGSSRLDSGCVLCGFYASSVVMNFFNASPKV